MYIAYYINAHCDHNNILYELYLFTGIFYKITYKSIKSVRLVLFIRSILYTIIHRRFANVLYTCII